MKKIVLIFLLAFLTMTFFACNTPQHFLSDFESFVVEIEVNATTFSSEDWDVVSEEYRGYTEEFESYRSQMTRDEIKEYGRLNARYYRAVIAGGLHSLGDIVPLVEGYCEEIMDMFEEKDSIINE